MLVRRSDPVTEGLVYSTVLGSDLTLEVSNPHMVVC